MEQIKGINRILQSRLEFYTSLWNIASTEIIKAKREQVIVDFGQQMANAVSSIGAVNLAIEISRSVEGCDVSDKKEEFIERMKNAILENVYYDHAVKTARELTSILYEIQGRI